MIFEFIPERFAFCTKCHARYNTKVGHVHNEEKGTGRGYIIADEKTYPISLPTEGSRALIYYQNTERLELIKLRAKVKELEEKLEPERPFSPQDYVPWGM